MRMKYEKRSSFMDIGQLPQVCGSSSKRQITFNHKVLVPILSTFEEQNAESILEPLAVLSLGPQD